MLRLTELTMANLLAGAAEVDRRDFISRADLLAACGMTTIISDYVNYHRLAAYIAWRTDGPIGFVMGVPSLIDIFDEKNYLELQGGILESFGRMFKNDLKLYVYPMLDPDDSNMAITVNSLKVDAELQPLYDYLANRGSFVDLDNYHQEYLPILSRDVLKRIGAGDEVWEEQVPKEVAELIKKRAFFHYQRPAEE
jgi:hypothetical protein